MSSSGILRLDPEQLQKNTAEYALHIIIIFYTLKIISVRKEALILLSFIDVFTLITHLHINLYTVVI